jgi:Flp pilus assembly protein TadB
MKTRILFSALIAAFLLASCGIMKNDDFASRKYTHFKKSESAVTNTTKNDVKENINTISKDIQLYELASLNDSKEVLDHKENNISHEPKNSNIAKQKTNTLKSSSKKEKMIRSVRLINDRLVHKANTTSYHGGDHSLLWTIIVILLILWIIGMIIDLGALINLLLVIILILFILWLLGMANF